MLSISGTQKATLSGAFSIGLLLVPACGEREATVIPPPPACDSAVSPCLLGCLAFLQRHSLPPSPPSHPLGPFPSCQQQNSALGLLSNPYTPAPSCHTGDCVPVQGRSGCGKDCLCGSHPIQTVTYQLLHSLTASTASPLSQTIAPMWGSDPCFNSPTLQVQVQSAHSPLFPFLPSSY